MEDNPNTPPFPFPPLPPPQPLIAAQKFQVAEGNSRAKLNDVRKVINTIKMEINVFGQRKQAYDSDIVDFHMAPHLSNIAASINDKIRDRSECIKHLRVIEEKYQQEHAYYQQKLSVLRNQPVAVPRGGLAAEPPDLVEARPASNARLPTDHGKQDQYQQYKQLQQPRQLQRQHQQRLGASSSRDSIPTEQLDTRAFPHAAITGPSPNKSGNFPEAREHLRKQQQPEPSPALNHTPREARNTSSADINHPVPTLSFESPEVQKCLKTRFDEVFSPPFLGGLRTDGPLKGVPVTFLTIEDYEKSAHWRAGWTTMDQALEGMSTGKKTQALEMWRDGIKAHPSQLIHPDYYLDRNAGLLTTDLIVKLTTCLTYLIAVKDGGKMEMEPIYFFLWFVDLQCKKMKERGKSPTAGRLLSAALGHVSEKDYYNPIFGAVYDAGKALLASRMLLPHGHTQRGTTGRKRARNEADDEDYSPCITVNPAPRPVTSFSNFQR